jgi:hypothetical protein
MKNMLGNTLGTGGDIENLMGTKREHNGNTLVTSGK